MRLPTPSMLVSVAALVVAMGGTSYAAIQLGSEDIKNDSLRSADIKNNQVASVDVRDGALRAQDFAPGQLPKGPQGPQGPQGEPGIQGEVGPQGPAGAGRWLLVDRTGAIVAQSGGFEIRTAYDLVNNSGADVPTGALGNVYIDANEDLSDNGIVVSIALQNQLDQNNDTVKSGRAAGPDANPEFSGEITATMCNIATVVACAPNGANTTEHLVVSPRMSDGSLTVSGDDTVENPNTHKRFYVIITGDSTDYVPVS